MASKLVPLNEAAAHVGVTPEELSEMRQRGEVYGYRDGASWKFKLDDLDSLIQKRAGGGSGVDDAGLSDLGLGGAGLSALGIKPEMMSGGTEPSDSSVTGSSGSGLGLTESGIGLSDSGLGFGSGIGSGLGSGAGKAGDSGKGDDIVL
ncbi:MAG TPA: helix-turn-helix domain-containing protein, partial [Pirellulales bacterium]|nr:helix-turn-helix domain-containing protein [Pirellulales bacterium]